MSSKKAERLQKEEMKKQKELEKKKQNELNKAMKEEKKKLNEEKQKIISESKKALGKDDDEKQAVDEKMLKEIEAKRKEKLNEIRESQKSKEKKLVNESASQSSGASSSTISNEHVSYDADEDYDNVHVKEGDKMAEKINKIIKDLVFNETKVFRFEFDKKYKDYFAYIEDRASFYDLHTIVDEDSIVISESKESFYEQLISTKSLSTLHLSSLGETILDTYFNKYPFTLNETKYLRDNCRKERILPQFPKSEKIIHDAQTKQRSPKISTPTVIESRKTLPVYSHRENLVSIINSSDLTILTGETGCGKSTQIPQYLLDDEINPAKMVLCTEPRRLSSIALAERIANERHEVVGDVVGYAVRLDSKKSENTRLLITTEGYAVRSLASMNEKHLLSGFSHIILDEIHERHIETDFLLIFIKHLLRWQSQLNFDERIRIVLMSATLHVDALFKYFDELENVKISKFHITGTLFPVSEFFLEDILGGSKVFSKSEAVKIMDENKKRSKEEGILSTTLIDKEKKSVENSTDHYFFNLFLRNASSQKKTSIDARLIISILERIDSVSYPDTFIKGEMKKKDQQYDDSQNAVLIFLPSWRDIEEVMDSLNNHNLFKNRNKYMILPLHSRLNYQEQSLVFQKPSKGVRKIIVSTNIAENSITIPDVVYIIDSGLHKLDIYDLNEKKSDLKLQYISKSSMLQRLGRAGRCRSGVCFRLFSKEKYGQCGDFDIPEITYSSLSKICLESKAFISTKPQIFKSRKLRDIFNSAIDIPPSAYISQSIRDLSEIGAFDKYEDLTVLGEMLGGLSVSPENGRAILLGMYMKSITPISVLSSVDENDDIFDNNSLSQSNANEEIKRIRYETALTGLGLHAIKFPYPSDHSSILFSILKYEEIDPEEKQLKLQYCKDLHLRQKSINNVLLAKYKLIKQVLELRENENPEQFDEYANSTAITQCLLCVSKYPHLGYVPKRHGTVAVGDERDIHVSRTSTISRLLDRRSFERGKWFLAFDDYVKGTKIPTVDSCTIIDPLIVILFGGLLRYKQIGDKNPLVCKLKRKKAYGKIRLYFSLNGYIKILLKSETLANRLMVLRKRFEYGFHSWISGKHVTDPAIINIRDVVCSLVSCEIDPNPNLKSLTSLASKMSLNAHSDSSASSSTGSQGWIQYSSKNQNQMPVILVDGSIPVSSDRYKEESDHDDDGDDE